MYVIYIDIYTCIMYVIYIFFNKLSHIHMYCMCSMYPSSSWRSLWPLQQLAWTLWCQQYRLLWVPHLWRHTWRLPRILHLLAWLFSLMFAVSHMWMCVPSLQLLAAETPCYPWSESSCCHFISLMPGPLSHCTTDAWPTWAVVPSSSYWHSKHTCTQRREPPDPRRVWNGVSWADRTDCADEVQGRTRQTYNQQSKPPIPVTIVSFSFLAFGSSPKHPISSLVQLQMLFPFILHVP